MEMGEPFKIILSSLQSVDIRLGLESFAFFIGFFFVRIIGMLAAQRVILCEGTCFRYLVGSGIRGYGMYRLTNIDGGGGGSEVSRNMKN